MRLRVLLEPRYGATYQQILAMAQAAEETGFDGFFRGDHYLGIDSTDASYAPTDSWTTLAAPAVQTGRIRPGTPVPASAFRPPRVAPATDVALPATVLLPWWAPSGHENVMMGALTTNDGGERGWNR